MTAAPILATPAETACFIVGRRSAAAILAGLYLLRDHAWDGYDNPHILEVGEQFTDCERMSDDEITALAREFAGAFE